MEDWRWDKTTWMRVFSSVPRVEFLGGLCNTRVGQSLMVSSVGYFKDVLTNDHKRYLWTGSELFVMYST